jgi:hypothetical protein
MGHIQPSLGRRRNGPDGLREHPTFRYRRTQNQCEIGGLSLETGGSRQGSVRSPTRYAQEAAGGAGAEVGVPVGARTEPAVGVAGVNEGVTHVTFDFKYLKFLALSM